MNFPIINKIIVLENCFVNDFSNLKSEFDLAFFCKENCIEKSTKPQKWSLGVPYEVYEKSNSSEKTTYIIADTMGNFIGFSYAMISQRV